MLITFAVLDLVQPHHTVVFDFGVGKSCKSPLPPLSRKLVFL